MMIALLLHNIRSAHNVGSIFRTADCAGVSYIYISGYTPTPTDRFDRTRKDIAKTALGAEEFIPWEKVTNVKSHIKTMKKKGWQIVGVEQDEMAIDYREFRISRSTLFIFGNEVRGISPVLRAQCDTLIEIPMHGKKESLNVAVAVGITIFFVIR